MQLATLVAYFILFDFSSREVTLYYLTCLRKVTLSMFKFKRPFCDIVTNLIYDTLSATVMNLGTKYHSYQMENCLV